MRSRTSTGRLVLGGVGAAASAYGAFLVLTTLPPRAWVSVGLWMGGAVAVHDALVVPLVLALAWVGRRLLPRELWGPAALGLAASGALTAVASVVLVRRDDAGGLPGLLHRDYVVGYGLAVAAVWASVAVLSVAAALRAPRRSGGARRRAGPVSGRTRRR